MALSGKIILVNAGLGSAPLISDVHLNEVGDHLAAHELDTVHNPGVLQSAGL